MKPAAAVANMTRVPSARDRKPESGIATTSAIRYEVCTQVISSLEAASPAWISDSDADTTWMSRNAMNMPKHIARKARMRSGSTRSTSAGACRSAGRAGCGGGGHLPSLGALIRAPRVCCAGGGVAGERARLGIHAHHDRHAGPQQPFAGDFGRHLDAHRQPLHDLGEIAGRIVRRQQRKHRTGGRREALDRALDACSGSASTAIDDRLAGPQLRELRLLEIGGDIDLVERNEAREPLAGLHIVAGLHRAIADHAVDRRADDGEGQIALGLGERCLEFVERVDRLLLLSLEHVDIGRGRDRLRPVRPARRRPPGRGWLAPAPAIWRLDAVAGDQQFWRFSSSSVRMAAAWAETSCVLACSTAASCAAI